MTMTNEEARAIKRPTIRIGRRYEFYSSVVETPIQNKPNSTLNEHTGDSVKVTEQVFKPGDPDWEPGASVRIYRVRADDGCVFLALQDELNGWIKDTGQFYGPSGKWGSVK